MKLYGILLRLLKELLISEVYMDFAFFRDIFTSLNEVKKGVIQWER